MSKEILLSTVIDEISMGPFGSDIKVDNFISSGIPVLNGSNLAGVKLVEESFNYISESKANSLGKANAKRGDIVVTHRGTLGQLSYIPEYSKYERYVISQSQFRVKFKKEINPIYISYLFRTNYGQKKLLSFKNHVGVPALAQATTNFKQLRIYIHNLIDQQRIASVLSSLDDKIGLNNRINAELEAMAKTLYDYWFVQFDFPNANGKPYKSSGGKMVYNEDLKREIPEGWEVGKIVDWIVSPKNTKKIHSTNYLIKGDIPIIDQSTNYIAGYTNDTEGIIEVKDRPAIVFGDHTRILKLINFDFARGADGTQIIFSKEDFSQYLLYYQLLDIDLSNYGYARHYKFLKEKMIIIPKSNQTFLFDDKVKSIYSQIKHNIFENQHLASLRDWLLPMLMNGQVGFKSAYQEQTEGVNVAAEVKTEYKTPHAKNENFHKIQSVYAVLWANSLVGVQQGEMATAKDLYLVDRIAQVDTGFTYTQHNWGSFDPTFKRTINNKQYFTKRNFPNSKAYYCDTDDEGYLLNKIPEDIKEKVKSSIAELHNKIFTKYFGKQKAEMKELYATILKCIEDTQSTDLSVIRQAMTDWKTPKQDFPNKAIKFSEQLTKDALEMIIKEGWNKKVIKE